MDKDSIVAKFTVKGEPVSKQRARMGQGKVYTPAKTVAAEQAMGWSFRAASRGHFDDGSATYGAYVEFHCASNQRRDVDNLMKTVLDGLNGIAWKDDSQVLEVTGRKFLPPTDDPRTEVTIYKMGEWPIHSATCARCGDTFEVYESWSTTRRYCSTECRYDQAVENQERTCAHCGKKFMDSHNRADRPRRFCSLECNAESGRVTLACDECGTSYSQRRSLKRSRNHCSQECRTKFASRRVSKPQGKCESCGGPVTRKQYKRCRPCITAGATTLGELKVITP